jgi:hypothetical protein
VGFLLEIIDRHRREWTAVLTVGLLLPNLIVLAAGGYIEKSRLFIFNFDYLVVPVLVVVAAERWGGRVAWAVGTILLSVMVASDLWLVIGTVYLADPRIVIDMLGFASVWPWRLLLPILVCLLIACFGIVGTLKRATNAAATLAVAACAASLLLLADQSAVTTSCKVNVLSSGIVNLFRPFINQIENEQSNRFSRPLGIPGRTLASSTRLYASNSRILSVAIESWGAPRDVAKATAMDRSIERAFGGDFKIIERDDHRFFGSTLEGEIRELCGLQLRGFPRLEMELNELTECLPARLSRNGWSTSAWHGNYGTFYRRDLVYPAMGFEAVEDFTTMRDSVPTPCSHLFVAICDRDVLQLALTWMASREPAFAHVMTLDTHFPLNSRPGECQSNASGTCVYDERIGEVLQMIGDLVRHADVKPDYVVLYGDHAPPFLDETLRAEFTPNVVPFFVLKFVPHVDY